jgi:hypothetical protein
VGARGEMNDGIDSPQRGSPIGIGRKIARFDQLDAVRLFEPRLTPNRSPDSKPPIGLQTPSQGGADKTVSAGNQNVQFACAGRFHGFDQTVRLT